ncbi:hypothetical protein [Aeromicrobium sp.]|uniref:hypothetical protein n=1 Tax=Aeromicrobium sp. TaxID=1871063 RepID=UPI003C5487A1
MTVSIVRPHTLRYLLVALAAILAIGIGFARPVLASHSPNLSATDRIKADPPPALFSDAQASTMGEHLAAQARPAADAMTSWWTAHGSTPDDAAFVSWLERQIPAPPTQGARRNELRQVQRLAARRTPAGIAAATWLETNGKKDIWKLYQHDQRELLGKTAGKAEKQDLKVILAMAKTASDSVAAVDRQSAPYVLDPTLRPEKIIKPGSVCPCSYPSRHAARSAAARSYLGYLAPHRLPDYVSMEEQVTYSRIYMAGHVQSDLDAGTMLGDMIAEYILVTRGHRSVPSPTHR